MGLKLNARKGKTLRTEYASNRERIAVNGEEVQAAEGPWCVSEARKVMGSQRNSKGTKIRLLKTLVRPVLLYGCETWKIIKDDERRLNSF